jgi:hypothetical protein
MQGDGACESGSLFLSAVEDFEEIRSCNLVCGTYCTVRSAVYRATEQYSTVLYVQFEWALFLGVVEPWAFKLYAS